MTLYILAIRIKLSIARRDKGQLMGMKMDIYLESTEGITGAMIKQTQQCSSIQKTLEGLVEIHIRDRILFHENQFAYIKGKSTELAIHYLVS